MTVYAGYRKEKLKEYALYKGEDILCMGNVREIAEIMGIKPKSVYHYKSKAYAKRMATHTGTKHKDGIRVLVCISGDDED